MMVHLSSAFWWLPQSKETYAGGALCFAAAVVAVLLLPLLILWSIGA